MIRPDVDSWALDLADHAARRSRDPSTKVGAVILRPDNTVASMGYNGFPRKTNDDIEIYLDRPRKLLRTVHAELNAILTAREPLHGYTLYVSPLFSCSNCAASIIQAGITKVVCRMPKDAGIRWKESFDEAKSLFAEAGVAVDIHHI